MVRTDGRANSAFMRSHLLALLARLVGQVAAVVAPEVPPIQVEFADPPPATKPPRSEEAQREKAARWRRRAEVAGGGDVLFGTDEPSDPDRMLVVSPFLSGVMQSGRVRYEGPVNKLLPDVSTP